MAVFKSVLILACLVASGSCQIFEQAETTTPYCWFHHLFHRHNDSTTLMPGDIAEWSTETPTTAGSSIWSYLSFGHQTTPSSILRLRRSPQNQYGQRPYYRPYNRYPNQAYQQPNRQYYQQPNRPYYQRPVETTTAQRTVYMPGSGPEMPTASSTYAPQFGWGVTYSNGATVKPTTSTANPAAAWYSNWLNSLPDSLKALYGVTTTASPQGLVGRRRRSAARLARRRRSVDEIASTESPIVKTLELSTDQIDQQPYEDASTESIIESSTKGSLLRRRRAIDSMSSSTENSNEPTTTEAWAMIAIEGQNGTSTVSGQQLDLSTSAPALR